VVRRRNLAVAKRLVDVSDGEFLDPEPEDEEFA
jgi:hypothetical protein